jgi:hypothetical protein
MPMIQPALSRGPAGADGSQWHVSSTTPETELGVDGDFCVNSSTGDFYQKDSGVWILKGNLTGPQGEQGVPGDPGFWLSRPDAMAEAFWRGEIQAIKRAWGQE